jgi:hypothetical protein
VREVTSPSFRILLRAFLSYDVPAFYFLFDAYYAHSMISSAPSMRLSSSTRLDGDREPPLSRDGRNRGTLRTNFLAQFHLPTLHANSMFLLSTVHHDRLRTPGVRCIHSQWRACEQDLLRKVAEIAGTREIRLECKKENGKRACSPASSDSDISYFCNSGSTDIFSVSSRDYKLFSI